MKDLTIEQIAERHAEISRKIAALLAEKEMCIEVMRVRLREHNEQNSKKVRR